jgi:hypothetical protein
MYLNDLLSAKKIDARQVLVFRHRPKEPELNKVLPWLAAEKPEVFNAYQQFQGEKLENAMKGAAYVASFIGREPGKALFIGLFSIRGSKPVSREEFWQIPGNAELRKHGMHGLALDDPRPSILQFDVLEQKDFYASWKGKLVVGWPPPERSWWRRAHRNEMPVLAVLEDSALNDLMPSWDEIEVSWNALGVLPKHWATVLSQWRGIYYIFDTSDGKGYVGSACGDKNLLGRWLDYAASGHGGNSLLRGRDAQNFRFSILHLVSQDMEGDRVVRLENTWKERLHTRPPYGLNDN